jgi:uncharacterized protein YceK
MKKLHVWSVMGMALAVAVVTGLLMSGCESSTTSDSAITITPNAASLTTSNMVATFTAAGVDTNTVLNLPLKWTVADSSLGTIQAQGGVTAIYLSTGKIGNNTVTVRDQAGEAGVAEVSQF